MNSTGRRSAARSPRGAPSARVGTRVGVLTLALMLLLMLLPAAVASAEPDFSATLDRANPTFAWESSGSGLQDPLWTYGPAMFRCTGAPFECEYILLHVQTAGELTLRVDGNGVDINDPTVCGDKPCATTQDMDAYMYKSDAAGKPQGRSLTGYDCATISTSETCKAAVSEGFYVVEVEYYRAVDASYTGTVALDAAPGGPPVAEPATITVEGCSFTLYYFKDSAERLQALVPSAYRVQPYRPYLVASPLVTTEGSATIAAAAYDCDRIEVPGSSPAPGIVTVLSVLVYPPDGTAEGPATADFYVLRIHANNLQLVEALASHGMPASLVPGMTFDKPVQSLGVRVEVPWSSGAYQLAATGFFQDVFHDHDNAYLHVDPDRGLARMDFVTLGVRDQSCSQRSDDHHVVECGTLTAEAGTPVADLFGASDRSAHDAWDHDPLKRAWFVLQPCQGPPASADAPACPPPAGNDEHEHHQ